MLIALIGLDCANRSPSLRPPTVHKPIRTLDRNTVLKPLPFGLRCMRNPGFSLLLEEGWRSCENETSFDSPPPIVCLCCIPF